MKLAWKKFVRSCQVCLFLAGFRRMKTLWIPGVTPQITPDWPWRADSSMLGEYQLDWPEMSIDAPSLHRYLSCNILTSPFWSNLTTPSWLSMDSRLPVESRSSPGKKIHLIYYHWICEMKKIIHLFSLDLWNFVANLKTIGIYLLYKVVLSYDPVRRTRFTAFVTFRNPLLWCTLKCIGNLPFFLWCIFVKFSEILKLNSSIVNPHLGSGSLGHKPRITLLKHEVC